MSEFDANTLEAPVAIAVLTHIVRSIVDDAEAVNVSSGPGKGDKILLEVRVGPGDLGRVIGRRVVALHKASAPLFALLLQMTMSMSTSTSLMPESAVA